MYVFSQTFSCDTDWTDATCLEGALKIKEVSYMHSEGVSVTVLVD